MIKALICDFARVLIFPKETFAGSLTDRHRRLRLQSGYHLLDHFQLNTELLDYLKNLTDRYELYIFTSDSSIQSSQELQPFLKPVFKDIFSGLDFGFAKNNPEAYQILLQKINKKADQVLFIDDSADNIAAAGSLGISTIQYQSNPQLLEQLDEILKIK